MGHWWEIARGLLPLLAGAEGAAGDGIRKVSDFLLGPVRGDLPRAAGLDALLREALEGKAGIRSTLRPGDLYDRLIRYRNQELPAIEFAARFPGRTRSAAAYVARRLLAERARKVRIRAGSDDAIRIWVNGAPVLAKIAFRGAFPDQEETEGDLRAGENVLLVEVSNAGGAWNLYFRLEDLSCRKLRLTDDDRLFPLSGE